MIVCLICMIALIIALIGLYLSGTYNFSDDGAKLTLNIDTSSVLCETDPKYLSLAMDVSSMRCSFHKTSDKDWDKILELSSSLAPAYLRFGGIDSDFTLFKVNYTGNENFCESRSKSITVTGKHWLKVGRFNSRAGLDLILDLNVWQRKHSEWDPTNALTIIRFSEEQGLPLHFSLGNEPDNYWRIYKQGVSATQLSSDFQKLRNVLDSRYLYQRSLLIGPDVMMSYLNEELSLDYLKEFLSHSKTINAVSWHQYYLNGEEATFNDFISLETFDMLQPQIESVVKAVREYSETMPIWISETGTTYAGGASKLSNRFIASFLWVDKLGLAAKLGMKVIIRQSLLKNEYSLITESMELTPDFWISVFYKHMVGTKVLELKRKVKGKDEKYLRFYGHCKKPSVKLNGNVVLFGMNLSNVTQTVIASGMNVVYPIYAFLFTAENNNLRSKKILLNSKPLVQKKDLFKEMIQLKEEVKFPLSLPPYSIGFWLINDDKKNVCEH